MSSTQRGPGRPVIGGAVHVRLGQLVEQVDQYATDHRISRAEAVRRLTERGLIAEIVDHEVG